MAITELASWPRPHFQPGGGEALVFYAIYGEFSGEVAVSGAAYRTAGVPTGLELRKLVRGQTDLPFSSAAIGQLLQPRQPELWAAVQRAPECLLLQGSLADPPDLNYLRDTVGLVLYFLDHGGVAVVDPQQFKLYDAPRWRAELFEPQPPQFSQHVVLLWSEDSPNTKWFHTRGLRKFGRPDLSMHGVTPAQEAGVLEMFNRFILLQAHGLIIPEGETIRMPNLPDGLKCHHRGSLEDPDFNNVHVEIAP